MRRTTERLYDNTEANDTRPWGPGNTANGAINDGAVRSWGRYCILATR